MLAAARSFLRARVVSASRPPQEHWPHLEVGQKISSWAATQAISARSCTPRLRITPSSLATNVASVEGLELEDIVQVGSRHPPPGSEQPGQAWAAPASAVITSINSLKGNFEDRPLSTTLTGGRGVRRLAMPIRETRRRENLHRRWSSETMAM